MTDYTHDRGAALPRHAGSQLLDGPPPQAEHQQWNKPPRRWLRPTRLRQSAGSSDRRRARRWGTALLAALSLPLLGGCGVQNLPAGAGRLPVVTTILPITLFTRTVAGDCADVTPLIPPASSPHAFQARPADLLALRRARVLVINGLGMEGFLDRLIRAADNPGLQVIDASRGIPPLSLPAAGHGDHAHGESSPDSHAHSHARTPEPEPAGDGEGRREAASSNGATLVNPHVWLDPLRAARQLETIRDGLIRADPGCAAGYRRRAAAAITQLGQLDRSIAAQLAPYRGRSFVAFHDVAPYFAQRYGLRADFLVDVPELNPSPRDLRRVAALVRASQLQALLSEPQQGDRSLNALAQDLGVRLSLFDPLETAAAGAPLDLSTYLDVMRRNTANLRQAFAPPPPVGR